jgi:hypothetical protein
MGQFPEIPTPRRDSSGKPTAICRPCQRQLEATTRAGVMLASFGVLDWRTIWNNSRVRISMTASIPRVIGHPNRVSRIDFQLHRARNKVMHLMRKMHHFRAANLILAGGSHHK